MKYGFSNPGSYSRRRWFFSLHWSPWEKIWIHNSLTNYGKISGQSEVFSLGKAARLSEIKFKPAIIIIIIIIMSRCQHESPWPSLTTHLYRPSFSSGLPGYILYRHRSSWSSCLCSSMWRGPREYVAYELILISPAMSHMSGSSNHNFRDGWQVAAVDG